MIQMFFGDCLEVMKILPEKSVDCFILDLPYGCLKIKHSKEWLEQYGRKEDSGMLGNCDWDEKIDLEKLWEQIKRLSKDDHTPILFFCTTKFGSDIIASNPSWFRYDLVWSKPTATSFLLANKMPMRSHEMIYVFSKKGAYYTRLDEDLRCVKSVIEMANKKRKDQHPTEKPVELYEWLLKRYCRETMLDATAGSFNSVFTAHKLGLQGIGIEKDEKFFKKAEEKFKLLG
jgi:DNA modification methylase